MRFRLAPLTWRKRGPEARRGRSPLTPVPGNGPRGQRWRRRWCWKNKLAGGQSLQPERKREKSLIWRGFACGPRELVHARHYVRQAFFTDSRSRSKLKKLFILWGGFLSKCRFFNYTEKSNHKNHNQNKRIFSLSQGFRNSVVHEATNRWKKGLHYVQFSQIPQHSKSCFWNRLLALELLDLTQGGSPLGLTHEWGRWLRLDLSSCVCTYLTQLNMYISNKNNQTLITLLEQPFGRKI